MSLLFLKLVYNGPHLEDIVGQYSRCITDFIYHAENNQKTC